MDAVLALMNAVFLAFVVSTMFNVGLQTTWSQLTAVLGNLRWLVGALLASLVAVPLIGWGLAEAFPLEGATFVALAITNKVGTLRRRTLKSLEVPRDLLVTRNLTTPVVP